jgi:6-phosphogluconate dehydrogenase
MPSGKSELGMIGLGVMGRNLLLNMADHGHRVSGYDKDAEKMAALSREAADRPAAGAASLRDLVSGLKKPRTLMMLVPAGKPVDSVLRSLVPVLEPGDLVIDGGNSHFSDTDRRAARLAKRQLQYLGVGISGGEKGARFGPSMMPGGSRQAYRRVESLFRDVAAKVDTDPCVAYLGPGSAGHYVKMVHNGSEYGLMQLIAESYDLMAHGLGYSNADLQRVYSTWNQAELAGFLMQITAEIFGVKDLETSKDLIDVILDEARQKGTGMWTSQDGMDRQVPLPTIDMAVSLRNMSADKQERLRINRALGYTPPRFSGNRRQAEIDLRNGLFAAMILTYAQGLALIAKASQAYGYQISSSEVARIWRGGCIIRAGLLEDIRSAFASKPDLPHLLLDAALADMVSQRAGALRQTIKLGATLEIPCPGLMASLAYYDAYRQRRSPANLIQAQRDFFGAHTYQRMDKPGTFHTQWQEG